VNVYRGGTRVSLNECSRYKGLESYWAIHEVTYADYSLWKPRLDELNILFSETKNLLAIISKVIDTKTQVDKRLNTVKSQQ